MRILVTRPAGDAEETAARLVEMGHQASIAPVLDIRFRGGAEIRLAGVQAVLVTSANGIRALARRTPRRDVKVLAVGTQSAAAARASGFVAVEDARGDAQALAELVIARLNPQDGALLHAAGAETRGRLAETLSAQGFTVRSEILYDAVAAPALPADAERALSAGRIDAVLVFSPRSARIFAELAGRAGLADACRRVDALCISEAAAAALAPLSFRTVRIAVRPDQDSLLALLG